MGDSVDSYRKEKSDVNVLNDKIESVESYWSWMMDSIELSRGVEIFLKL